MRILILVLIAFWLIVNRPSLAHAQRSSDLDPFGEIEGGDRFKPEDFIGSQGLSSRWTGTFEAQVLKRGTPLNAVVDLICLSCSRPVSTGRLKIASAVDLALMERSRLKSGRFSRLVSVGFDLPKAMSLGEIERLADREPCLVRIAPDPDVALTQVASGTHDPYSIQQEHLAFLSAGPALERFSRVLQSGPRPTIAILDTGVDLSHPDLAANAWVNSREIPGNKRDDDRNGFVDDVNGYNFASGDGRSDPRNAEPYFRHGTHVAGLAGARVGNGIGGTGIHGMARIMSVNVFGEKRTARVSDLENAIRYSVDNGAEVITLSIGGRKKSATMESVLKYAIRRGAVIIAASGNDGVELSANPKSPRYLTPAALGRKLGGMITVTAVDTRTGSLSAFANYSMLLVELAAPGALRSGTRDDGLLSTFPKGQYGWLSGTSMAAPVVAGAAALVQSWLKSAGRPANPALVESILIEGSRHSGRITMMTNNSRVLDLMALADYLERNYPLPAGGPVRIGP